MGRRKGCVLQSVERTRFEVVDVAMMNFWLLSEVNEFWGLGPEEEVLMSHIVLCGWGWVFSSKRHRIADKGCLWCKDPETECAPEAVTYSGLGHWRIPWRNFPNMSHWLIAVSESGTCRSHLTSAENVTAPTYPKPLDEEYISVILVVCIWRKRQVPKYLL